MGYVFSFDPPGDNVPTQCAFNGDQMNWVRLIMIEAGAVAGDGFAQALRFPGLEPTGDTLPITHFTSNDGWRVTAAQAAFVAGRLRAAREQSVPGHLLGFIDDAPGTDQVEKWVDEFVAFNDRAAERDGYHVW